MKRLICILFVALILFSFGVSSAEGTAPQAYKDAGFTFFFSPDSNTLIAGGLGAMPNAFSWSSIASEVQCLIIAEGINSIPSGAFSRCANLDSIIFPSSLRHIDHAAFTGCNNIQTILYPGDLMDLSQIIIENNVLELRKAFTISRITPEDVNAKIDSLINGATSPETAETKIVETKTAETKTTGTNTAETIVPKPAPFPRPRHYNHSGSSTPVNSTTPVKSDLPVQPVPPAPSEEPTGYPITETDKYNRITHQIEILDDGTIIETRSDYPGYDYPYKRSLVTTTAPDGTKTSSYLEIDAGGNVFSRTDYTLDDDGNVTGGSFQTFGSQPGSIAADTDKDGNRILIYTYSDEAGINSTKIETLNDNGQVIHSILTIHTTDGVVMSTTEQTNTYDENGTILSSTEVESFSDGRFNERKTDYENDGRSNTEIISRYNADGDLLYQNTSTSIYEENGALETVNTTQGAPDHQRQYASTYTYDENGNRTGYSQTTTEEDGTTWHSDMTWKYDENGKLTSSSSQTSYSDGSVSEIQELYNEHGNPIYTYHSNEAADGTTYQSTTTSDYTYGGNGNTILVKRETNDSNGGSQKEVTSYNSEGQMISTVRTRSGTDYETTEQQFWTYGDDEAKSIWNSQTKYSDGSASSSTTITENGRTASTESTTISAGGSKSQSKSTYNEDGSHSELHSNTYTDGFSWTQVTEYDDQGNALNQRTSYQYQNGSSSTEETTFTYDNSGNKTAVTEGTFSSGASTNSTTVYDTNGQVQSYINESRDENGMYSRWTYDGNSYTDYSTSTDANGNKYTDTHIYDSDHKSVSSSSETISSDGTVAVYDRLYDESGRLATETQTTTFANGGQSTAVSTYEYDDEGQPSYTMVITDSDGNTSTYQYTYDPEGQIWTGTPVITDSMAGESGTNESEGDPENVPAKDVATPAEDEAENVPAEDVATPAEDEEETSATADNDVNSTGTDKPVEPSRMSVNPVVETYIPENVVPVESAATVTGQNTVPENASVITEDSSREPGGSSYDADYVENASPVAETSSGSLSADYGSAESESVVIAAPAINSSPASEPTITEVAPVVDASSVSESAITVPEVISESSESSQTEEMSDEEAA